MFRTEKSFLTPCQQSLESPETLSPDNFCTAQKTAFGDTNEFAVKGGLATVSKALSTGMVLVMSIWDDHAVDMLWLDAPYPPTKSPSAPGVSRGSCSATSGNPVVVEANSPGGFSYVLQHQMGCHQQHVHRNSCWRWYRRRLIFPHLPRLNSALPRPRPLEHLPPHRRPLQHRKTSTTSDQHCRRNTSKVWTMWRYWIILDQ